MTGLIRRVELGPHGVTVGCISLAAKEITARLDTINKQYKVLKYTPNTCPVCRTV